MAKTGFDMTDEVLVKDYPSDAVCQDSILVFGYGVARKMGVGDGRSGSNEDGGFRDGRLGGVPTSVGVVADGGVPTSVGGVAVRAGRVHGETCLGERLG